MNIRTTKKTKKTHHNKQINIKIIKKNKVGPIEKYISQISV